MTPCEHPGRALRASSHLDGEPLGDSHASVYVCDRPTCISDARAWIREVTQREAVLIPIAHGRRSEKAQP